MCVEKQHFKYNVRVTCVTDTFSFLVLYPLQRLIHIRWGNVSKTVRVHLLQTALTVSSAVISVGGGGVVQIQSQPLFQIIRVINQGKTCENKMNITL